MTIKRYTIHTNDGDDEKGDMIEVNDLKDFINHRIAYFKRERDLSEDDAIRDFLGGGIRMAESVLTEIGE